MSEEVVSSENQTAEAAETSTGVKLQGAFAYKKGMTQIFDDSGVAIPVTVLEWKPLLVTQVKSTEKEGYNAVQIAGNPRKEKNSSSAQKGHFKKAGSKTSFKMISEIRQDLPEGVAVGAEVSIESFAKGDTVSITSKSKGRGFAGAMKRWNFAGGPASHGSKFHRTPGSVGNRTFPGRVIPGKKLPGHFGDEVTTVKNVQIVDVLPEQNALIVKGPVPGARNSLVKIMKQV